MSDALPVFVPAEHAAHQPRWDFSDGHPPVAYPEVAARIEQVHAGLERTGLLSVETVSGAAEAAVAELHDGDYVAFLRELCERLGPEEEYIPSIFHGDLRGGPLRFRGGMYTAEIGSPLTRGAYTAALRSAEAARRAAARVRERGGTAVALCRPPGHHAGRRRYGGYCLFNNAYIAARVLAEGGQCCPVLDVDYHLGDGSAELADSACPYFSLHADPWRNYPHLDARWVAPKDAHLTTLGDGTDGATYRQALEGTLEALARSDPDALVLSLGFDTAATDTIQDDSVLLTVADFEALGARIGAIGRPLVVVLEGGYDVAGLSGYMEAFARGLRGASGR
ncbi:acetylpolyamine aminohydrolase [Arhodomonas sp. SL1]|uniref:acetylpolyamine aminohydrolase n=1 Tax=Arhodomonas sp. SL1 TaxID=3425691 RepID=UPI003F883A61